MNSESNATDKAKERKKAKKTQAENSKQPKLPNWISCYGSKQTFTKKDARILCSDKCKIWYCVKCALISDAGYKFLSSVEAEDIGWFGESCVQPAKVASEYKR